MLSPPAGAQLFSEPDEAPPIAQPSSPFNTNTLDDDAQDGSATNDGQSPFFRIEGPDGAVFTPAPEIEPPRDLPQSGLRGRQSDEGLNDDRLDLRRSTVDLERVTGTPGTARGPTLFGERPIGVSPVSPEFRADGSDPDGDAEDAALDPAGNDDLTSRAARREQRRQRAARNPTRQLNAVPVPTPSPQSLRPGATIPEPEEIEVRPQVATLPPPVLNALDPTGTDDTAAIDTGLSPDEPSAIDGAGEDTDGEVDPYAPLGVRIGSFRLFPAIEFLAGGQRETGNGSRGEGTFSRISPEVRLESDWTRHSFETELRGSVSRFTDSPGTDEETFQALARGRIDVTGNTRIELEAQYDRERVIRGDTGAPETVAEGPFLHTRRLFAALEHRFNRLTGRVSVETEQTDYENARTRAGVGIDNGALDFRTDEVRLRVSYEISPKTEIFVEGFADREIRDRKRDALGQLRGAEGRGGSLGATWRPTAKLELNGSVGIERRDARARGVEATTAAIFDSSLVWTPSALTTVTATAVGDLTTTNEAGQSAVTSRDYGLTVDHQLTRQIALTGGLLYGTDDFKATGREDERFEANARASYAFNRHLLFIAEARHTITESSDTDQDEDTTEFGVGLRVQY
ncbi:MAG: outer membrane beta-barrel protein [Pseudomonadota bacterium]